MLANAIVCVAIVAMAANAMLSAGLISERIAVRRLAQQYVAGEYARAMDALFSNVAGYGKAGGVPDPLPSISPLPPRCAAPRSCALTSSSTIELLRLDPNRSLPCTADSACALNEETNSFVREGRVVARIAVAVRAADGTLLATREQDVTVRTFAAPPYAAIAGASDRTLETRETIGEDAGTVPRTPDPCSTAPAGQSADTVVRVAYVDTQTGECRDGSSWRTSGY